MTSLITVDKDKLTKLLTELIESRIVLDALYSGGVSQWEWFGESFEQNCTEDQLEDKALASTVEHTILDLLSAYHGEVMSLETAVFQ